MPAQIIIYLEYPEGTSISKTNLTTLKFEKEINYVINQSKYIINEKNFMVESYVSQIGSGSQNPVTDKGAVNDMPNKAKITLTLAEFKNRKGLSSEILRSEIQKEVDNLVQEDKDNIAEAPVEPKEPSRAFQMARSLNPEPDMPPADPMESWDKPAVSDEQMQEAVEQIEQEEFEEKIGEAKQSFAEWDAQNEKGEFKPSGTTTESFLDEVERFNEVADADELLEEEPQSSLPKVSAGQVNEEQAQELAEENPEFVLSRESVKIIDEEPEEEYEEVTIPSESELKSMTKAQINQVAVGLEFDVPTSLTKNKMIESFLVQTDEFIKSLQDSGDFVSASDSSDDKNNIRDGGYF